MANVLDLKTKLIDRLIEHLEHPGEHGVDPRVLSTAAKVVKDFAHEAEEDADPGQAHKVETLAKYLERRPGHA